MDREWKKVLKYLRVEVDCFALSGEKENKNELVNSSTKNEKKKE